MVSSKQIETDNHRMVVRQQKLRRAADIVTAAWAQYPEVVAIGLIGSVARPLWKEVPRFAPYKRKKIELWHECKDVDLALWLDDYARLGEFRRSKSLAIKHEATCDASFGIADYSVDTFIFESQTNCYIGRLCQFNRCPKRRSECLAPGCGEIPFNRVYPDFIVQPDMLLDAPILYTRSEGVMMYAADLASSDC